MTKKSTAGLTIRKMTLELPQDLFERICDVSEKTGVKKTRILTGAVRIMLAKVEKMHSAIP